ncbi:hypothetical protein CP980_00755 [Streptomyces vinaceus]|uniref:Uncharacterized protein n=1 Tax=Streptomyces vinaceus TaxID=1960 RepID=A0A5J6J2H0_STRVI|nr:hypothetical protein CP980_00755 [Streptomyces vinaceus]
MTDDGGHHPHAAYRHPACLARAPRPRQRRDGARAERAGRERALSRTGSEARISAGPGGPHGGPHGRPGGPPGGRCGDRPRGRRPLPCRRRPLYERRERR